MVTVMTELPGMMVSQGMCVNDCTSQWQMVGVILHTLKQHNLCTHVQSVECIHMHECMHSRKHICTHRHNYNDGTFGLTHAELNIHAYAANVLIASSPLNHNMSLHVVSILHSKSTHTLSFCSHLSVSFTAFSFTPLPEPLSP